MSSPTRSAFCLLALFALVVAGCKPPAETVEMKEKVSGPPDLVKAVAPKPGDVAYQLKAFHLNHVWTGADGRPADTGAYRAKITVWDYSDTKTPIAELYFHDAGGQMPASSNPGDKRPFQLHFPMSTFDPILGTLRGTNEPVFLYCYDGGWAIGTYLAEPVGID